jgi:H+-transporting ATPase
MGWDWALFVCGCALLWFLVTDRVILLAYRVLDPVGAPLLGRTPVAAMNPADIKAQIARRAYELYEQHGHQDGHAAEDWLEAERQIRRDQPRR